MVLTLFNILGPHMTMVFFLKYSLIIFEILFYISNDHCRKGSVMHYGAYSFAIDPSIPTIITRQPDVEIGQRRGFSEVNLFFVLDDF